MAREIRFWEDKLKEKGYKFSMPRKYILRILREENKFLSADEIYLKLKEINSNIGIATVYRTLELLSRLSLICKINVGTEKSLYMLSQDCREKTSSYLICEKCGKIILNNKCLKSSIKIRLKDNAEKNIYDNCKLKINNFQVFFSGLCDKCAE